MKCIWSKYTNQKKLAEGIKEHDPTIWVSVRLQTHFKYNDTGKLKIKLLEKIYHININQKKVRVALFISNKVDLRAKKFAGDWVGHYIIIKQESARKTWQS